MIKDSEPGPHELAFPLAGLLSGFLIKIVLPEFLPFIRYSELIYLLIFVLISTPIIKYLPIIFHIPMKR